MDIKKIAYAGIGCGGLIVAVIVLLWIIGFIMGGCKLSHTAVDVMKGCSIGDLARTRSIAILDITGSVPAKLNLNDRVGLDKALSKRASILDVKYMTVEQYGKQRAVQVQSMIVGRGANESADVVVCAIKAKGTSSDEVGIAMACLTGTEHLMFGYENAQLLGLVWMVVSCNGQTVQLENTRENPEALELLWGLYKNDDDDLLLKQVLDKHIKAIKTKIAAEAKRQAEIEAQVEAEKRRIALEQETARLKAQAEQERQEALRKKEEERTIAEEKARQAAVEEDRRRKEAAEKGDAKTQYEYALYLEDLGRRAEAAPWLKKAIEKGGVDLQYAYALRLEEKGRAKEAFDLFRDAADNGNTAAACKTGIALLKTTNTSQAFAYLHMAASSGDATAKDYLQSRFYRNSTTPAQIHETTMTYLVAAADEENPYASKLIGKRMASINPINPTPDELAFLEYVAQTNNAQGQYLLGVYYQSKGRLDMAVSWYRKAANKGHAEAKAAAERLKSSIAR